MVTSKGKKIVLFALFIICLSSTILMQFSVYSKSKNYTPHVFMKGEVSSFVEYQLDKIEGFDITIDQSTIRIEGKPTPFFYAEWLETMEELDIIEGFEIYDNTKIDIIFEKRFGFSLVLFELTIVVLIVMMIYQCIKSIISKIYSSQYYVKEYVGENAIEILALAIGALILVFMIVILFLNIINYTPYIDTVIFNTESILKLDTYINHFEVVLRQGEYYTMTVIFIGVAIVQVMFLMISPFFLPFVRKVGTKYWY